MARQNSLLKVIDILPATSYHLSGYLNKNFLKLRKFLYFCLKKLVRYSFDQNWLPYFAIITLYDKGSSRFYLIIILGRS